MGSAVSVIRQADAYDHLLLAGKILSDSEGQIFVGSTQNYDTQFIHNGYRYSRGLLTAQLELICEKHGAYDFLLTLYDEHTFMIQRISKPLVVVPPNL